MAMPKSVRFLTRTAILLALALVFQIYGGTIARAILLSPQFVVGPLVNLCLLVATAIAGVWSGGIVALLTPITAWLLGQHGIPLPLVPVIAVGNLLYVLAFWWFDRRIAGRKPGAKLAMRSSGIVVGAAVKCGWLWGVTALFANLGWVPPALLVAMGWLQAVTALIGGALALLVLVPVEAAIPKTRR